MKRAFPNIASRRHGGVLVIALLMVTVAVIGATAAARYCLHELGLSKHSAGRVQALHAAEAGVEVAIQCFYEQQDSGYGWTGWNRLSNGVFEIEYSMDNMPLPASYGSVFRVQVNTNDLTIVSSGAVGVPRFDVANMRTLQVVLEGEPESFLSPFEWGLVAKDQLNIVGNPYCDSYDSRYGPYGGTNIFPHCSIGATGIRDDAIRGGGATQVYGDAAISAGADVDVHPKAFWSGGLTRDLELDFPKVLPPRTDMTSGSIGNANQTIPVTGNAYLGVPSVKLINKTLKIEGNGQLDMYVDGDFSINTAAELTYVPTGSGNLTVRLFVNGDINIKGELNTGGIPVDLQIYGTENCTSIDCQANRTKSMTIYAPQAEVHLSGNSEILGAVVGENIRVTGNFDFHYDEALGDLELPLEQDRDLEYVIVSWMEI